MDLKLLKRLNILSFTDYLLGLIAAVSVVACAQIWVGKFDAIAAARWGLVLSLPLLLFVNRRWQKPTYGVLIILGLTLFLRSHPAHYFIGGQDQGTYYILSRHLDMHGSGKKTHDPLLQSLPENLKPLYKKLAWKRHLKRGKRYCREICDDKYEGIASPGVYLTNSNTGGTEIQFLSLHPAWMSIFANLFGENARPFSMVFFAALSVWLAILIVRELCGAERYALAAGLLLALNPMHAFFSLYPTSEVTAVFFNLGWFYLLLRTIKEESWLLATLTVLLGSGYFFTRISGFAIAPAYLALLLVGLAYYTGKKRQLCGFIGLAMLVMIVVGYKFSADTSFPYTVDQTLKTFRGLFRQRENFAFWMPYSGIAALGGAYVFASFLPIDRIREFVRSLFSGKYNIVLPAGLILILGYSLYLIYFMYFTPAPGERWGLRKYGANGGGWEWISTSALVEFIFYSGVFLSSFALAYIWRKNQTPLELVLRVFLLNFLGVHGIIKPFTPYMYYYARYLISDLLPFAIIAAVLGVAFTHSAKWRRFGWGAIVFACLLFSAYSLRLANHKEMGNTASVVRDIAKKVGSGNILFVNNDLHLSQQKTGTELFSAFASGTEVHAIRHKTNLKADKLMEYFSARKPTFFLSPHEVDSPRFSYQKTFEINNEFIEQSKLPPRRKVRRNHTLYLYMVNWANSAE